MRGTLKNLVDKLREFYAAGLLTLVEPAPAGSTSLIPPKPLKKTPTKRKSSISASAKVSFDAGGMDRTSFAPFVLQNVDEDGEFRLIFSDWEWLHKLCGGDHLGDYYLNGPGVEGIVLATREINRLDPEPECMDLNSEGDACYIHFTDRDEAIRTATLSAKTINDRRLLRKAVKVALDQGYGD